MKKQKKEYKFNCKKCGKQYFLVLTQSEFKRGKYRKHCSRSCANSRQWSQQDKLKKSIAAKNSSKLKQSARIMGLNKTHERKEYKFNCKKCGKQYFLVLTQSEFKRGKYRKHCSRSCANSHTWTQQTKRKISQSCKNSKKLKQSARISGLNRTHERKEYKFNCKKCGKQYFKILTQNEFKKGKYTKFCSRSCANSRTWTQQTKRKISQSCKNSQKVIKANELKMKKQLIKVCKYCGKQFKTKRDNKKFCNHQCYVQWLRTPKGSLWKSKQIKSAYANGTKQIAGGDCSWIYVDTSIGRLHVQGTYQVRMCKILDKMKQLNQIKDWQYTKDKIKYIAEDNKKHTYFLDFKVFSNDGNFKYIQTKGFQKQRDSYKWNAVKQKGFQLQICFDQQIKQYQKKYNLLY